MEAVRGTDEKGLSRTWNARIGLEAIQSMGKGSWAILAILLVMVAGSAVVCYLGWTSAAGTDVPTEGYVALIFGVVVSVAVGAGLMALVFYSSRAGYDEPARLVAKDDASSNEQS
jgi:hypothetical protein